MKTRIFHSLFAGAIAIATQASSLNASIIINNGDISGNAYTYSVLYNDLTAANSKIVTDPAPGSTATNFALVEEGGGTRYLVAQSFGPNSIQYEFDFSLSDYRITDVAVRDRLTLFASATQTGTLVSEYSVDGTNWIVLKSISPALNATADTYSPGANTVNLTLSDEARFYYRATASITEGDPFFTTSFQWNRLDNVLIGDDTGFSVGFTNLTAVPEPSTAAILVAAVAGLAIARRRRF